MSYGIKAENVHSRFRKIGDLGEIAEEFASKRRQNTLFSKRLETGKVFDNLRKLLEIEGSGSVERKLGLVAELLNSATGKEAKYIVRTLLNDLRVGVADALLVDALAKAFYAGEEDAKKKIEEAQDLANDFALVFSEAAKGKKNFDSIEIMPGKPMKTMLAVKVEDFEDAFRICGSPAALEFKYDGFRMLINKDKEGKITLFTRKLENVTKQFPDVVSAVRKQVKGESFILDSEVVGYDAKTGKYKPFEYVSQRIRRKYDIDKLIAELPVEVNVFDVIYLNGKSLMSVQFRERRKQLERIVKSEPRKIRVAEQIIASTEAEAKKFYEKALKIGEEGIMFKSLEAPYKSGRRVGYMVKLKPIVNDLDLVIVGAEYGSGKRAGWLTSYIVACRDKNNFLEIGKVSSGLKEKEEEGTSYDEMTKLLKPLIAEEEGKEVKVKSKIVVSVTYQNIQESPSYSSGYALRFPRITQYRPDRSTGDIATLDDIKREVKKRQRK
jgi:DNA ligase-1